MVFSEPRKIRPKKKSVLFSRGLKSGCRNLGSFRRPFLLEFCRVNNFLIWFRFVFFLGWIRSRRWSRLAVLVGFFLPFCCDLWGGCFLPCGVLFCPFYSFYIISLYNYRLRSAVALWAFYGLRSVRNLS